MSEYTFDQLVMKFIASEKHVASSILENPIRSAEYVNWLVSCEDVRHMYWHLVLFAIPSRMEEALLHSHPRIRMAAEAMLSWQEN